MKGSNDYDFTVAVFLSLLSFSITRSIKGVRWCCGYWFSVWMIYITVNHMGIRPCVWPSLPAVLDSSYCFTENVSWEGGPSTCAHTANIVRTPRTPQNVVRVIRSQMCRQFILGVLGVMGSLRIQVWAAWMWPAVTSALWCFRESLADLEDRAEKDQQDREWVIS